MVARRAGLGTEVGTCGRGYVRAGEKKILLGTNDFEHAIYTCLSLSRLLYPTCGSNVRDKLDPA